MLPASAPGRGRSSVRVAPAGGPDRPARCASPRGRRGCSPGGRLLSRRARAQREGEARTRVCALGRALTNQEAPTAPSGGPSRSDGFRWTARRSRRDLGAEVDLSAHDKSLDDKTSLSRPAARGAFEMRGISAACDSPRRRHSRGEAPFLICQRSGMGRIPEPRPEARHRRLEQSGDGLSPGERDARGCSPHRCAPDHRRT